MFASLKNKIKEETGTDVTKLFNLEQKEAVQVTPPRTGQTDLEELTKLLDEAKQDIHRLETANVLLEESLRLAQEQKDLITDEHDKIENLQHKENVKLKNLLLFKDQEAVDKIASLKQAQLELAQCKHECLRLQGLESKLEDVKDDLERLRHSAAAEKTHLSTSLASAQEENRHLRMRLEIIEQSRTGTLEATTDDQVKSLLQERKLLEQRLEEAHLHLTDIKSTWSGQNLSLETQVARLSRQVAEETADKRKALRIRDQYLERIKELEKELEVAKREVSEKDNKIRLLNDELEDVSNALTELRKVQEEKDMERRREIEQLSLEKASITAELAVSEKLLNDQLESSRKIQEDLKDLNASLEKERAERVNILLKNAEISQSEESLKQDLKLERDEVEELLEQVKLLQRDVSIHEENERRLMMELDATTIKIQDKENLDKELQHLSQDLIEKNKVIKVLNNRLSDMKKTLQEEIQGNNRNQSLSSTDDLSLPKNRVPGTMLTSSNGTVTMDDISFKYLKHVIFKFITCRDVEAKHLIRAVSTLLRLTSEEERVLDETYKWKMSWFFAGSKPDIGQWNGA